MQRYDEQRVTIIKKRNCEFLENTDIGEDGEDKTDRIGSFISIENALPSLTITIPFYRLKKKFDCWTPTVIFMTVGVQRSYF